MASKDTLKFMANIGGTVGAKAAKFVFEPIMPVTVNTISNAAQTSKEVRTAIRQRRAQKRASQAQDRGNQNAIRKANNVFRHAMSDLQNGDFSMEKATGDLYNEFDNEIDENFDMPTGDEAAGLSAEEISLMGDRGIAQSIIKSTDIELRGMEQLANAMVRNNAIQLDALSTSLNATMMSGFNEIGNLLTMTNSKLDMINENIARTIEFQNNYSAQFYGLATDLMNTFVDSMSAIVPNARTKGRKFDLSKGFSLRGLGQYIKEGIGLALAGEIAGPNRGPSATYREIFKSNAIQTSSPLADLLLNKLIPKGALKKMSGFDRKAEFMMSEALNRLAEAVDKNGLLGSLGFAGMGAAFGNRREVFNNLNLSKYHKGPMPWNGIAQKTLTEVIPELLTSIDAGINKTTGKRYYNFDTGRFERQRDVVKRYTSEVQDRFGVNMKDGFSAIRQILDPQSAEACISGINKIISVRMMGRGTIKGTRNAMEGVLKAFGISETQGKNIMLALEKGLSEALESINDLHNEMEQTQHIYRSAVNGANGESVYDRIVSDFGSYSFKFDKIKIVQDPDKFIHDIQKSLKLPYTGEGSYDLAKDPEVVNQILNMKYSGYSDFDIEATVRSIWDEKKQEERRKKEKEARREAKMQERLARRNAYRTAHGKRALTIEEWRQRGMNGISSNIMNATGSLIDQMDEKGTNLAYEALMGESVWHKGEMQARINNAKNKIMPKRNQNTDQPLGHGAGAASTRISRLKTQGAELAGNVAQSAERVMNRAMSGAAALNLGRDRIMNEMDADAQDVATVMGEENATTLQGSIIQSNNAVKTAMASIVGAFQRFGSMIFGKEGILSRIWNSDARKKITGKLFTNEDAIFHNQYLAGKQYLSDIWEDTKDYAGMVYEDMRDKIDIYLGKKKPEDEKPAIEEASEDIVEAGELVAEEIKKSAEIITGEPIETDENSEGKKREIKNKYLKMIKEHAPRTLVAGAGGALLGTLNMAHPSLLGLFLPGGPIAGAIVGSGLSILSKTEAFKKLMYGEIDEKTGERTGGLISKEMSDKFHKAVPFMIGGAAFGAIRGVIKGALGFNSGLGVMGMQLLPGGILGGAIVGAGLSMIKNSDTFKNFLFGKMKDDGSGEREGTKLTESWEKLKVKLGSGGKGLAIGGLTAGVISNLGILGAAMTPGGIVGGAIVGLGMGIASTTEKFKEWMFGTKELDENGNETGKRNKDGFLTRTTNLIRTRAIEPLMDAFRDRMEKFTDWAEDHVLAPVSLMFGPIKESFMDIKEHIVESINTKLGELSEKFMKFSEKALKPITTKLAGFASTVGKGILGVAGLGARMALSPLSFAANIGGLMFSKERRQHARDYYFNGGRQEALKNYWANEGAGRNIFQKGSDIIGSFVNGDLFSRQLENRAARQDRVNDRKKWRKIDRERKSIIKDLGGAERKLTDREVAEYRKRFARLGINENDIQTSDDVMDLLYRRDIFKKNQGMDRTKTPEEKTADTTVDIKEDTNQIVDWMNNKNGNGITDKIKEGNASLIDQIKETEEKREEKQENIFERINSVVQDGFASVCDSITGTHKETQKLADKRAAKAEAARAKAEKEAEAEARREKEESEDPSAATSGADFAQEPKPEKNEVKITNPKEKKKGLLSRAWDWIKGGASWFAKSPVGGVVIKGIKLGVMGTALIGLAELISPNFSERLKSGIVKTGDFLRMFNDALDDPIVAGKQMAEFVEGGVKNLIDKFINFIAPEGSWVREKLGPSIDNLGEKVIEYVPKFIEGTKNFIKDNSQRLIDITGTVIKELGPPVIELVFKSLPHLMVAIGEAGWTVFKDLGRDLLNWIKKKLGFGGETEEEIRESNIEDYNARYGLSSEETRMLQATGHNVRTSTVGTYTSESAARREQEKAAVNGQDFVMVENPDGTYELVATSIIDDTRGNVAYTGSGRATRVNNGQAMNGAINAGAHLMMNAGVRSAVGTGLKVGGKFLGKTALKLGGKLAAITPGAINLTAKVGAGLSGVLSHIPIVGKVFKGTQFAFKGVAKVTSKEFGEGILKTFSTIIEKIKGNTAAQKVFEKFGIKDGGVLGKITSFFSEQLTKIKGALADTKLAGKITKKLEEGSAKATGKGSTEAATLGLSTLIMSGIGGIVGWNDASNLFHVPSDQVDTPMKIIAALFGALFMGTTLGCIVDTIISIIDLISGGQVDLKYNLACNLYKLVAAAVNAAAGKEIIDADKLDKAKAQQNAEVNVYNALHGTNLTEDAYNDIRNKTVFQKGLDWAKGAWGWVTGKDYNIESSDSAVAVRNHLSSIGMTDEQIAGLSQDQIKQYASALGYGPGVGTIDTSGTSSWLSTLSSEYNKMTLSPTKLNPNVNLYTINETMARTFDLLKRMYKFMVAREKYAINGSTSLGFGSGDAQYSQKNTKWGNMRIGTFSNGHAATMKDGGCGPTALSAIYNQVHGFGPGPIDPGQVGQMAVQNHYITNGGANAGLFTEGAARLGLRSHQITTGKGLVNALASGAPTVLTGKGNGSSDPYTRAGHIVVSRGITPNGNARILDTGTGRTKEYSLRNVLRNTEHAWSYSSLGFGEEDDVGYDPYHNPDQFKRDYEKVKKGQMTKDQFYARWKIKYENALDTINKIDINYFKNAQSGDPYTAAWSDMSTFDPSWNRAEASAATTATLQNGWNAFVNAESGDPSTASWSNPATFDPDYQKRNTGTTTTSTTTSTDDGLEYYQSGLNRGRAKNITGTASEESMQKRGDPISRTLIEQPLLIDQEENTGVTFSEGISSQEEWAALWKSSSFIGKLKLLTNLIKAKFNATMNGTDLWTEYAKLGSRTSESGDSSPYGGRFVTSNGELTKLIGTDRDRYIAAALSQVGYKGKFNNSNLKDFDVNYWGHYTKYNREMYGPSEAPWCANFAQWSAKAAGVSNGVIWQNVGAASCTEVMKNAKKKGIWKYRGECIPNPGDQILFNFNRKFSEPATCTECTHIGIVKACDGIYVSTIEGNTGNSQGKSIVAERKYRLDDQNIIGYVCPKWTYEVGSIDPSKLLTLGYGKRTDVSTDELKNYLRKQKESTVGYGAALGYGPMEIDPVTGEGVNSGSTYNATVKKKIEDLWNEYSINTGGGAYGYHRKWFYSSSETPDPQGRYHAGQDMVLANGGRGSPIKSFTTGEVVRVNDNKNGRGYYVVVKDGAGYYHIYQHLQERSNLKVGDRVQIGQQVGKEGSSDGGNNNGYLHLHYEVRTPLAGRNHNITGTYTTSGKKAGYITSIPELNALTVDPKVYLAQYSTGKIDPNALYTGSIPTENSGVATTGENLTVMQKFAKVSSILANWLFKNFGIGNGIQDLDTTNAGGVTSDSGLTASVVSGSNAAETAWKTFMANGFSKYGAAGLMGNLHAESTLIPNNVQGSWKQSNQAQYNADYTNKVDSGIYSREDFIKRGPGGGGYGLAQWTYSTRKAKLYDAAKAAGVSIGDTAVQLQYLLKELGEYGLINTLKTAQSVKEASDIILHQFEQPGDQSERVENQRASYGLGYLDKYGSLGASSGITPIVNANGTTTEGYGDVDLNMMNNAINTSKNRNNGRTDGTVQTLKDLGFGPGMDVNVDTGSTDGRLDKILGVITEWASRENDKASSQASPASSRLSMKQTQPMQTVQTNTKSAPQPKAAAPYKERIMNQHHNLALRVH